MFLLLLRDTLGREFVRKGAFPLLQQDYFLIQFVYLLQQQHNDGVVAETQVATHLEKVIGIQRFVYPLGHAEQVQGFMGEGFDLIFGYPAALGP